MAKQFAAIGVDHRAFIERQRIFFTASAATTSRVNISPRGTDWLRVLDAVTVAYLDLTGSGNETAAHARADGRATIMLCAFDGPPQILRLYGRLEICRPGDQKFEELYAGPFGAAKPPLGTRQIVCLHVEMVQTSCGFGVPLFSYEGERQSLDRWAEAKGAEGLDAYRRQKNHTSIDGLPTGLTDVG